MDTQQRAGHMHYRLSTIDLAMIKHYRLAHDLSISKPHPSKCKQTTQQRAGQYATPSIYLSIYLSILVAPLGVSHPLRVNLLARNVKKGLDRRAGTQSLLVGRVVRAMRLQANPRRGRAACNVGPAG